MEKNKPEIRFRGFEGEWEEMEATHIFRTNDDRNHPNLPVLSVSQEFGMIIREHIGFKVQHNQDNEVGYKRVVPGQFVIHLRSFQGGFAHSSVEGITSPAYTIIEFLNTENQDDIYWKYVLTSKDFIKRLETVTYGIRDGRSISFEDFSELGFQVPPVKEQRKIGTLLTTLDKLIHKLELKLEKLRNIKQALLNQMLTNINRKEYAVPSIRFKNYNDKWQMIKLGNITERIVRKNSNLESTLPLTISAQYGLIDQGEFFNACIASKDLSNYYLIRNGEFAYNKSSSDGYPYGAIKRLDKYDKGVLSTLYIVFSLNDQKAQSDYIAAFYDTGYWHKEIVKCAAEGARNHGLLNISAEDFFDTILLYQMTKKNNKQ